MAKVAKLAVQTPAQDFMAQFSDVVRAKAGHILQPLSEVALPAPTGWNVMVAQYVRPEKVGSIILADSVRNEDRYQGRCGIVLALGADAYKGEKFTTPWCAVGDIVAWPAMENAASRMTYAKQTLTVIPDDRVVLVGVDPEQVA